MKITLSNPRGEAPRFAANVLPPDMSVSAVNCRLLNGNFDGWKDIASVFLLGKPGPTNTVYPYNDGTAVTKWFSWAQSELQAGAVQVDVARIPVANDTEHRVVFTGTGKPMITNSALAIGGLIAPNGPYPLSAVALAVPAPTTAPSVQNIPGSTAGNVTTTLYTTDMTGWVVGYTGAFGSVTVLTSGGHPNIPYPCYDFNGQQANGTWANINGGFGQATATAFTCEFDCSTTDVTDLTEQQDVFFQIVSDGAGTSAIGAELFIHFSGGSGEVTWTDRAAGAAAVVIAPPGTVGATQGVHVKIVAGSPSKNASGTIVFTCSVTLTDANTGLPIASATGLQATYAGDTITPYGRGGVNPPDSGHVYFGRISMVVSQPATQVVPVFSNYLYTDATAMLLQSGPSPASTPSVKVDNNNINIITFPAPAPGANVSTLFLYRVASGASGAQYLQVLNGMFSDGGFPICAVGGTANAILLSNIQGDGPEQDTYFFLTATATSTGAVTINGDSVVDSSGSPVGAGGVVAGQNYTAVFERGVIQATKLQADAQATVIQMAATTGIVVGQVVTDAIGAVPPGTTVAAVTAGVSIQLSAGLTTQINAGTLLFFAVTDGKYTLLPNFQFRDATPTADLGSPLESADWDPPPDDMVGIIALPNETMAAFTIGGNTLLLSVAGQPQAWPLSFQLGTDSPIVALSALGFNVGILTQGRPYTAYGTDPASFQMGIESFLQGCEGGRGVSYHRSYGAVYPSTDGIYAYAGFGEIKNLTQALYTRQEWQLLNPSSIIGLVHQGLYFFWYDATSIGGGRGGKILDLNPQGFGLISLDFHNIAAAIDSTDDGLFMVLDQGQIAGGVSPANNQLCQWEGAATTRPFSYTSKLWLNPYALAYQLCRLRAEGYTGIVLKLYADGTLFATLAPTNDMEFVIPPQVSRQFQAVLSRTAGTPGQVGVRSIELVERSEELYS